MDTRPKNKHDTFVDAILRGLHPLHSTRALLVELEGCAHREADRMAGELALSRREGRGFAGQGADAPTLLPRRMARLHLDIGQIGRAQPRALWDLQKLCTLCDDKSRCAHDLACGADSSAWRSYCPNDDMLTALKAQVMHLSETLSPSLAPVLAPRPAGATVAVAPEQRPLWPWLWALLFFVCAWIAVDTISASRLNIVFDRGYDPAPSALGRTAAEATRVSCLDTSCLNEGQQAVLETVAAFQEQGAIYSSTEQMAAAQRAALELRKIRVGEAAACRQAGGTTSYGPMFQVGCTPGVVHSGRQVGYSTCQPMAAGGVCFFK